MDETSSSSEELESNHQTKNEFVALTEVVRQHYVRYLERQLQENVCAWAKQSRNHHKPTAWASIARSVETLEARATKACMAAQVYQRAMIKMIAAVRRNTQECRLADALLSNIQQEEQSPQATKCFVDKCTQTEHDSGVLDIVSHNNLTLQQKIDLFQSEHPETATPSNANKKHRHSSQQHVVMSPAKQSPTSSIEDAVAQELAALFGTESTDLNDIFGIKPNAVTDDPQVCAILQEIENAELPSAAITNNCSPLPSVTPQQVDNDDDLRKSRWPCELYAQRRKLNACLVRLLDADWRCENVLRYKFQLLFGEDSDDEFATGITSPSIDLVDEVLLSSCMLRIRPWIVRHLMRPWQEGLIANRFLFKKLAKMLAHSIVCQCNAYASKQQVKQAVEHLFCVKAAGVQTAYDLDDLAALVMESNEQS